MYSKKYFDFRDYFFFFYFFFVQNVRRRTELGMNYYDLYKKRKCRFSESMNILLTQQSNFKIKSKEYYNPMHCIILHFLPESNLIG